MPQVNFLPLQVTLPQVIILQVVHPAGNTADTQLQSSLLPSFTRVSLPTFKDAFTKAISDAMQLPTSDPAACIVNSYT